MKKGISLVSLAIVIIVMVILSGIVIITTIGSFQETELNAFVVELLNIQNAVDEYSFRYERYPVGATKTLSMSEIQNEFKSQFENEIITDEKIEFKMVDLTLIGINDTEYGNNEYSNDVYVLSETTGKVYYLAGVAYEDEIYYTLTDKLDDVANIANNFQLTSKDIKVYDVVFTPNTKEYTNKPVTVTVKLPKQATINNITTTNSKSVSEEVVVGMYKQVEINTTSDDKPGNYKITVNYTYNNIEKTAEYEVTNYDNSIPIISCTEKIDNDLKIIKITTGNDSKNIKKVKYEERLISDKSYFGHYGKTVMNNEVRIGKNVPCTIYMETQSGNNEIIYIMPESWKPNVSTIVNAVPIPKGFVASQATGENTKNGGLVIYEGPEPVNDTNVEEARRQRNQYVWVPVGKEEFVTKFVREDYNNDTILLSNTLGTDYWEVTLDTIKNMPLKNQDENYMTSTTLAEVQSMYASVKEYEGFYIARYEAGIDTKRSQRGKKEDLPGIKEGTKVYSLMGKIPYTIIPWTWNNNMLEDTYGAVDISRRIYPNDSTNTTGVVSTLTYGAQWDATLKWFVDTKAIANITSTISLGNYSNHVIKSKDDLNEGALVWDFSTNSSGAYVEKDSSTLTYPKSPGTNWVLSTGALKAAKINNIYDMAGNINEWTMEGNSTVNRSVRGGIFVYNQGILHRAYVDISNSHNYNYGFRPCLYIKK